jgi:hypothetical protein
MRIKIIIHCVISKNKEFSLIKIRRTQNYLLHLLKKLNKIINLFYIFQTFQILRKTSFLFLYNYHHNIEKEYRKEILKAKKRLILKDTANHTNYRHFSKYFRLYYQTYFKKKVKM